MTFAVKRPGAKSSNEGVRVMLCNTETLTLFSVEKQGKAANLLIGNRVNRGRPWARLTIDWQTELSLL